MATVQETLVIGPEDAGRLMTSEDYDAAEGEEGWRYELIRGVLVVSPIPKKPSRGMASRLIYWLEAYVESRGKDENFLTALSEEEIPIPDGNRRRCDVAVWMGLSPNPVAEDVPAITVEFVSKRRSDVKRDDVEKRTEYLAAGVREYWIIDRFRRTMTALRRRGSRWVEQIIEEGETFRTPLLPGLELDLARLFARADALAGDE